MRIHVARGVCTGAAARKGRGFALRISLRAVTICMVGSGALGCVATVPGLVEVEPARLECRTQAMDTTSAGAAALSFHVPTTPGDREALDRWCRGVGASVIDFTVGATTGAIDSIVVISWNVAVGSADLASFVRGEQQRIADGGGNPDHLLVLVQEALGTQNRAPSTVSADARWASRIARYESDFETPSPTARRATHPRRGIGQDEPPELLPRYDILDVARELEMGVIYVPSMRNGEPDSDPPEDRGNAVLTPLPVLEAQAIELPFEAQRRVAISIVLEGSNSAGDPWRVRVVNTHLDVRAGSPFVPLNYLNPRGRRRQMEAVVNLFGDDPALLVAGDLNTRLPVFTTFDAFEPALGVLKEAFPMPMPHPDERTTPGFLGLGPTLDHMFLRAPEGWNLRYARREEHGASDHLPLIGTLSFGG